MVFAYCARYNSKDLTWTIYDDRLIFSVCWDESEPLSLLLEILEGHISIKWSYHDITILRGERPIEDDDIPLSNACILHAISLHFHEIRTRWMLDEVLLQVHLTRRMRLRSKWQSCTYWLKDWISCESVRGYISLILEEKHSSIHKLLEKELYSRPMSISEELSHLIEWLIYSATTEKGPEDIYFLIVFFIDSHSIMYKCTLNI